MSKQLCQSYLERNSLVKFSSICLCLSTCKVQYLQRKTVGEFMRTIHDPVPNGERWKPVSNKSSKTINSLANCVTLIITLTIAVLIWTQKTHASFDQDVAGNKTPRRHYSVFFCHKKNQYMYNVNLNITLTTMNFPWNISIGQVFDNKRKETSNPPTIHSNESYSAGVWEQSTHRLQEDRQKKWQET